MITESCNDQSTIKLMIDRFESLFYVYLTGTNQIYTNITNNKNELNLTSDLTLIQEVAETTELI